MSRRTLVVHTGGVGDFICTLPALRVLGENTTIEIAGIPERAALAVESGIAAAAHDLERTGFHTVFSTPSPGLREFCSRYDRAIVFMNDGDGTIHGGLKAAGVPAVDCHSGVPPESWDRPAARWYARCLNVSIQLPFALPFRPTAPQYDVIIHPGSGDPKKNWPMTLFEALSGRLESIGRDVAWCIGPAERHVATERKTLPALPLVGLTGALRSCNCFVGNDSGIGHLASVTACPTVSIFGPTNTRVWTPIGPHTRVLARKPWPTLEHVESAVVEQLGI